jgi:Na+-translocating ferredoxin:NAD+ oxidoreductase RnfE subunit
MNQLQNFTKGFIRENPILVLVLGTCPTLATTSSSINGMGMGIANICADRIKCCYFIAVGGNSR